MKLALWTNVIWGFLRLIAATPRPPGECPHWKDIMTSPGFLQYLVTTSGLARLDIGVPPQLDVDEIYLLLQFLKTSSVSVRIFDQPEGFCTHSDCNIVQSERLVALLVYCRSTRHDPNFTLNNLYFLVLNAIASNISDLGGGIIDSLQTFKGDSEIEKMKHSGHFHVVFDGAHIFVIGNYEVRCITCPSYLGKEKDFMLLSGKSLSGCRLTFYCQNPYVCKNLKFSVIGESLLHKNASVRIGDINGFQDYIQALAQTLIDPAVLFHAPLSFMHFNSAPCTSTTCHYDRVGASIYVRALQPLPKEALLFLPFCKCTWFSLLTSFKVCLLLIVIRVRFYFRERPGILSLATPLAASMLQQDYPVPRTVSNCRSSRFILGVWWLMLTVLATGYRGVLTSLFENVPLDGKLSKLDLSRQFLDGCVECCVLNPPPDYWFFRNYNPTSMRERCFERGEKLRVGTHGWNVFLTFDAGFRHHDAWKEELLSSGYVESNRWSSPFLTGPRVKASSPYRNTITRLFMQVIEGGLIERSLRREEFIKTAKREFKRAQAPPSKAPLTLDDVRPCVIILITGFALCLVVFLIEYVLRKVKF